MGLLSSIFSGSRPSEGAAPEAAATDNLAQARLRARQRLIGAVVLVGIGVIGFPLLFETQPRPIPVDVPIEIPRKDNAPTLRLPDERATAPQERQTPIDTPPAAQTKPEATAREAAKPEIITETAAEAGLEPKAPSRNEPVTAAAPLRTPPAAAASAAARPAPKPEPRPAAAPAEGSRAQAILEGRATAPAPASAPAQRFIVQIGAFADPALARETRLKVERLGMVTYTHVAQTPQGARTRVRVGPVATRQEADKLAERLKAAGLPAAILTL